MKAGYSISVTSNVRLVVHGLMLIPVSLAVPDTTTQCGGFHIFCFAPPFVFDHVGAVVQQRSCVLYNTISCSHSCVSGGHRFGSPCCLSTVCLLVSEIYLTWNDLNAGFTSRWFYHLRPLDWSLDGFAALEVTNGRRSPVGRACYAVLWQVIFCFFELARLFKTLSIVALGPSCPMANIRLQCRSKSPTPKGGTDGWTSWHSV